MYDLRQVRQYLTDEVAILSTNAWKYMQGTLARIVTNCKRNTLASPIFRIPHWLPVEFCRFFKMATLVCKFL